MKKMISIIACCIVAFNLIAQRATDEEPYGLREDFRGPQLEVVALTAPDMARIEGEDMENDKNQGPIRYAFPVLVRFTPENSGVWAELPDGSKLWRLKVNIPNALATVAYYDRFWLPEGGKFFVYSEETRQSIGAIISEFIDGSRENPVGFATALIYGENVVYEYYQPSYVKESPIISINRMDYGYRYIHDTSDKEIQKLRAADNCYPDDCGNGWPISRAVARLSIPMNGGSFWCSCALVNNTANNSIPYVLTADHCLKDNAGTRHYDAIGNYTASGFVFYWRFQNPDCYNSQFPPPLITSTGATVVANNEDSDFALLKINSSQDPSLVNGALPFYLGWDRSGKCGIIFSGVTQSSFRDS